jgi:CRISPR-associated protein Csc3
MDGNASRGAGGFDYRWHTIPPLARNLAVSPIYAFHYLKKWQRREQHDGMGDWKASLYLYMVNEYLNGKECPDMTHAKHMTELYRQFYRAEKLNSNNILRPLSVAAKAMLDADTRLFDSDDALEEAVRGKMHSFMENVVKNRADGRLPKGSTPQSRQQAIDEFSAYMVHTIYRKVFGSDRAALRGKQLNLLKNACEALYLDAWRNERKDQWVEETDGATGATDAIS